MSLLELGRRWALSLLVFDIKNILGSDWALFLQQIQILEFHLKTKMSPL